MYNLFEFTSKYKDPVTAIDDVVGIIVAVTFEIIFPVPSYNNPEDETCTKL
jgi:hypothetical protein